MFTGADNMLLAGMFWRSVIRVWHTRTGQCLAVLRDELPFVALVASPRHLYAAPSLCACCAKRGSKEGHHMGGIRVFSVPDGALCAVLVVPGGAL